MNAVKCCNTAGSGTVQTVSAMLDQISIQAKGRGMAMNLESYDKVENVIDKLELMLNLFTFYWFAIDKVDFNKDSLNGLNRIIIECITELKEAVK
jgi:hypothetical protein